MQVERTNLDTLVVNKLPDGSTVIVDAKNETVFALNATAGAAWDACSNPTTLSKVTESMQHSFGPEINEELAQEAILQLHDKNLVKTSGGSSQATRREFLTTLSAIALPVVVSLSIADQRAYALVASSRPRRTPPPPPPPPPPIRLPKLF
jgi:Coenzyme PQQ synthesis protein D (PqqD)